MDKPFSVNDRVAQHYQPNTHGTISRVNEKGFRVTWDSISRPKGVRRVIPRLRLWYPWTQSFYFHNIKDQEKGKGIYRNDDAGTVQGGRNQPRVYDNAGRKNRSGPLPDYPKGKASGGARKGANGAQSKGSGKASK